MRTWCAGENSVAATLELESAYRKVRGSKQLYGTLVIQSQRFQRLDDELGLGRVFSFCCCYYFKENGWGKKSRAGHEQCLQILLPRYN